MKAVLKIEFQRLFRSVTFYISLGIGLILTMTQFVMVGLQESMHILDAYSPKGISEPSGVFSSYFGMAGPPLVYRQIYYLILPILAVFAYATTFCADHNSVRASLQRPSAAWPRKARASRPSGHRDWQRGGRSCVQRDSTSCSALWLFMEMLMGTSGCQRAGAPHRHAP